MQGEGGRAKEADARRRSAKRRKVRGGGGS